MYVLILIYENSDFAVTVHGPYPDKAGALRRLSKATKDSKYYYGKIKYIIRPLVD